MKIKTRWGKKGVYLLLIWLIFWIMGFIAFARPSGSFPNCIEPLIFGIPFVIVWQICIVLVPFSIVMILCFMKSNTKAEDL